MVNYLATNLVAQMPNGNLPQPFFRGFLSFHFNFLCLCTIQPFFLEENCMRSFLSHRLISFTSRSHSTVVKTLFSSSNLHTLSLSLPRHCQSICHIRTIMSSSEQAPEPESHSTPLTVETDTSIVEGDSGRSESDSHRSHISVSSKLTDMKFLREHPHHQHHHHHPHHHHHLTPPHIHNHATDPHLSYHPQPALEPMTHAPTDDELSKVSEELYGGRVVISNKVVFEQKIALFKDLGIENLLVVSDFDFTISKFKMVNGSRGASCHRILEDCGLLSHDYHVEAQAIQRKYYPLEVDPNLDEESRVKYMI